MLADGDEITKALQVEYELVFELNIQSLPAISRDKNIRVIVLLDNPDLYDDADFRDTTSAQFLKEYADSNSIYDKY